MDATSRWQLPLIGLVQGLILAALHYSFDLEWAVPFWVRIAVDLTVLLPVLHYATESIPGLTPRSRTLIIGGMAVLAIALHEYAVWVFRDTQPNTWLPVNVAPILILLFIATHLLMHWRVLNPSHHSYRDLFNSSWRNAILCIFAVGLTGVFWLILNAGAELFKLIGLDALERLIRKPWFIIPASASVFSVVIATALLRFELIENLRRLLLGLLKWFLPLVLGLAAVWVLCLPFTGLKDLFATRSAAWIMLPTVALAVLFSNAAFQDGDEAAPYYGPVSRVLKWLWLAVIPLSLIALWAFWLRIGEYSWTAERIWGLFVTLIAMAYALGYALSVLKTKGNIWMPTIAQTNRAVAVAICVGIFALLSPILDAHRLEASAQTKRILGMMTATPDPANKWIGNEVDLDFAHETGRFGTQALDHLESPGAKYAHAEVARIARMNAGDERRKIAANLTDRRRGSRGKEPLTVTVVNPPAMNVALDQALRAGANDPKSRYSLWSCRTPGGCTFWWVDLNADSVNEVVVFGGEHANEAHVYALREGKAVQIGYLDSDNDGGKLDDIRSLHRAAKAGATELVPNEWKRIKVGDTEYGIH